jgi:hypothetical protein
VNLPPNSKVDIVLQWNDQWGQSANDYNLYLSEAKSGYVVGDLGKSETYQSTTKNPIERVVYTNNKDRMFDAIIDVSQRSGTTKTLEIYIFPSDGAGVYTNNIVAADSIFGHHAVLNVISVAAAPSTAPSTIEPFSSQGPATISFPSPETRSKPDITGVDAVSVTGAGGFPNIFNWTSAAAPHIAAIVAHYWGSNPSKTPAEVRNTLYSSAQDLGVSGKDTTFGYGLANALTMQGACGTSPSVTGITPNSGNNTLNVTITGTNFANSATVKLNRSGSTDIIATDVTVVSTTTITCTFPLTGVPTGQYDVVVTNPDAKQGILTKGFTVGNGGTGIGAFRPGTAQWSLDMTGNFAWDISDMSLTWGAPGDIPLIGDWNGDGKQKIGIFRPGTAQWILDYNGNKIYDGPAVDKVASFGQTGYNPVVGDWDGTGKDKIGVEKDGIWAIDYNGNYMWDGAVTDRFAAFGQTGDIPVVGDWDGTGIDKIGSHKDGFWSIDYNGNYVWEGAVTDRFAGFGQTADKPVVGDWNGDGKDKIGMEINGFWATDYNGNYLWEGVVIDRFAGFGSMGDTPAVGDWDNTGTAKIGSFKNGFWAIDYNGNYVWDGAVTDRFAGFGQTGDTPVVGKWS